MTLKRNMQSRDSAPLPSDAEISGRNDDHSTLNPAPAATQQQQPWLRRLSTFSSRASSRQSSPRPESSIAASPSNTSNASAHADWTSPMLPLQTPPSLPQNKLVKRSASLRGDHSSPVLSTASKIPTPTLRRPHTSHQRSATLKEHRSKYASSHSKTSSADAQWRNFFAPKVASEAATWSRRRNSTGIPNPIKRIYPDRKYIPTLLSAGESIIPANVDYEESDDHLESTAVPQRFTSDFRLTSRFFSSPAPAKPSSPSDFSARSIRDVSRPSPEVPPNSTTQNVQEGEDRNSEGKERPIVGRSSTEPTPRRSFSISDLLPTEAQMWKRPTPSKVPAAKYRRRSARTSSGTSSSSMGTKLSTANDEPEPPAKRRDLAGATKSYSRPTTSSSHKQIASSPLSEIQPNPSSEIKHNHAVASRSSGGRLADQSDAVAALADPAVLPCTAPTLMASHRSHRSTPLSEFTSNLTGSDSEVRSGDDEGLDSQGETIYDSVRTRATKSSPGRRGPAIETIFDDPLSFNVHGGHTMLKDFLHSRSTAEQRYSFENGYSIIEEDENISTPAKSNYQEPSPTAFHLRGSPDAEGISSSPPDMPSLLNLRRTRFSDIEDDQASSWSFGEEDDQPTGELPVQQRLAHLGIQSKLLSPYLKDNSSSATTTPQRHGTKQMGKDARSSIFDWSEQQPLDKSPGNHSPPRPKTVHGKKDAENRGSRPVGRRAPSGIHARSQSVPVAQEENGKRGQVLTNKFGTWGVGTKGVSEDWDEDFDFEALQAASSAAALAAGEEKRYDSGIGMFVPKAIREQQTNVLANIDLLRDWGLLIEELKDLRARAVALDLISGNVSGTWSEIDAMIDLADQESDEHTLAPRYSPPSSPSFNYDAFDDPIPVPSPGDRSFPKFALQDQGHNVRQPASPPRVPDEVNITPATPRRPRKDSEAVAKSVIEALQQKRVASDPGPAPEARSEKVHFDTATLKRILPYVQELRDKVKRELREAEGLYTSPRSRGSSLEDPSFSKIFQEPPESPSTQRKTRRSTNATDNAASDDGFQSPNEDLAARLRLMMVM
ncbi:hypothetical protein MBLNU459_g1416t1 [Dothideomycetes sp. NU459]